MPNINISVAEKIATNMTPDVVVVCGNSDYTATFSFDEEWAAEADRVARFVYVKDGTSQYQDVPFTGDTVAVPTLYGVTYALVGVYAGDLRTTTPAKVLCDRSILCGDPPEASPEKAKQLQEQIAELTAVVNSLVNATTVRLAEVTLSASKWTGSKNVYSQVVTVPGVTPYSKVDLLPSVEQLAVFHNKDIAFVAENEGGTVTVYSVGVKPTADYTMQCSITEVSV